MVQAIQEFIETQGAWTVGGMVICAGAAIEMAIRTIVDLGKIIQRGADDRVLKDLSADLGGMLFYGLCAVNIIPYAAIIGAAVFTIYSISSCENQDAYFASVFIGKPIKWFGDKVAMPFIEKVLWPVIQTIGEIAGKIIKGIGEVMKNILDMIPLPENPVWIGVGAIGVAVLVVKVVLPALGLG